MSTGKYLGLPEARKQGLLDRFAKEHPSTGDAKSFESVLDAMTKRPKADRPASRKRDRSDD